MAARLDGIDLPVATGTNEFWIRTLSSVILIPAALVVVHVGGIAFTVGVAVLGVLIFLEWCMVTGVSRHALSRNATASGLGATLAGAGILGPVAGVALWGLTLALAVGARLAGRVTYWLAGGVFYAGLAGMALVLLRHGAEGRLALYFLLAIVWATDIGAYLVGRTLGGPKLWPRISPKKTWSGAIGGLLIGAAAGIALLAVSGHVVDAYTVTVAALLSLATQVGDWLESAIKRAFSVKDSGTLIPGHGGLLDRLDGLILAAIVAAMIGIIAGGVAAPGTGLIGGFQV